ncbi:hypothetical protein AK85_10155 [Streptococcus pneumoniae B1598]|nr:hypothetical protein AK85_10155 [Streptococcus pneumoniae B1598]
MGMTIEMVLKKLQTSQLLQLRSSEHSCQRALMGWRGNSGVIRLSFSVDFSQAIKDKDELTGQGLGSGLPIRCGSCL